MSSPPKRNRVVRVEDELWSAAQATAAARRQNLSEEIRAFLRRYTRTHARQSPAKEPK